MTAAQQQLGRYGFVGAPQRSERPDLEAQLLGLERSRLQLARGMDERQRTRRVAREGDWGTWQLLSLEDDDGLLHYDPPFIELDLQPSGQASRWTCDGRPKGLPCPAAGRRACVRGATILEGTVWRVELRAADGASVVGRGTILTEPSGDIAIDGEGILPRGGHYRRVAAPSRVSCVL